MKVTLDMTEAVRQWEGTARRLFAASKVSAEQFLRQQGGLFVIDAAKMTPPFDKHGKAKGNKGIMQQDWNFQKKTGEKAARRRIHRTFTSFQSLPILRDVSTPEKTKRAKDLKRYASDGNLRAIQTILLDSGFPRNAKVITHASYRIFLQVFQFRREGGAIAVGRSRDSARVRFIVLNNPSINATMKAAEAHVGTAKAGWVPAARKLGRPLPAWITRHATPGLFNDSHIRDDANPYIEIGNLVSYGQAFADENIIAYALAARVGSMAGQLESILKKGLRGAGARVT